MKPKCLVICLLIFIISCNSKINQYQQIKDKQYRTGKWIEKDSVENGLYVMKGRYKHSEKVGVWRTYFNQKLYQKDKIKDSIINTKIFYPNGKLMEKGQSKLIVKKDERHWFYSDKWRFYDENGDLKYEKFYHLGKKADSINIKKGNN